MVNPVSAGASDGPDLGGSTAFRSDIVKTAAAFEDVLRTQEADGSYLLGSDAYLTGQLLNKKLDDAGVDFFGNNAANLTPEGYQFLTNVKVTHFQNQAQASSGASTDQGLDTARFLQVAFGLPTSAPAATTDNGAAQLVSNTEAPGTAGDSSIGDTLAAVSGYLEDAGSGSVPSRLTNISLALDSLIDLANGGGTPSSNAATLASTAISTTSAALENPPNTSSTLTDTTGLLGDAIAESAFTTYQDAAVGAASNPSNSATSTDTDGYAIPTGVPEIVDGGSNYAIDGDSGVSIEATDFSGTIEIDETADGERQITFDGEGTATFTLDDNTTIPSADFASQTDVPAGEEIVADISDLSSVLDALKPFALALGEAGTSVLGNTPENREFLQATSALIDQLTETTATLAAALDPASVGESGITRGELAATLTELDELVEGSIGILPPSEATFETVEALIVAGQSLLPLLSPSEATDTVIA
ncbi:MAG: hypothetical protein AAGE61_13435 [Pseudomonadota bacterium]